MYKRQVLQCLLRIEKLLTLLIVALRYSTYKPGEVSFKLLRGEGTMLIGVITLPPPGAPDVVSRQIKWTVNGGEEVSKTLPGDATSTEEISVEDNSVLAGTLVDIDDAGNESLPREFSLTIVDTIAPPQPGEVGFTLNTET